jgi:hypothetical protein
MTFHTEGSGTVAERMRIDSSGNVGIGVTTQNERLRIGSATAGEARLTIEYNSNVMTYFGSYSGIVGSGNADDTFLTTNGAKNLILGTNSTERMRIDTSGNVGINTTDIGANLSVRGDASPGVINVLDVGNNQNAATTGDGARIRLHCTTDENRGVAISSLSEANYAVDNSMVFYTSTASTLSEKMRLDSSGNLLVGTTSTTVWNGNVGRRFVFAGPSTNTNAIMSMQSGATTANNGAVYEGYSTNTTSGSTALGSIAFLRENTSTTALSSYTAFFTNSGGSVAERMRIDSSGALLVGTTTNAGAGGVGLTGQLRAGYQGVLNGFGGEDSSGLYYSGSTSNGYVAINSNGSNVPLYISLSSSATVGTLINFADTTTNVGTITTNGTTTAYNTSSDARLKENIADAEDAGAKVDAIQVRQFDWKADGSHQDYGMIAQELMTVAPEAVSGDPESDDMMGVDYSKLVPMLVKEIQSLRARVHALEGK